MTDAPAPAPAPETAPETAPVTLRPAVRADVPTILAMVRALAEFEREPDAVEATVADLERHGFGAEPVFRCLMAELEAKAVGFALYFPTFSTWTGRPGLYIEDLWVDPAARKSGAGRALVEAIAAECVAMGGARVDLAVLDWNPARGFYSRIGFHQKTEWLGYRLDGAALREVGGRAMTG